MILKLLGLNRNNNKRKTFPVPCLIVDYSESAKFDGIECDSNKLIYHFFWKDGEVEKEVLTYTRDKLKILKKVHKIPCWDNTKTDNKLPVYSRSTPGIIKYTMDK